MLAAEPGTARSCRTAHPCRASGSSSRAVRRSPVAPRARRWRPGWAGTVAPSRLPWPRARQPPGRAGGPAGGQGLPHRPRCQGWRRPARAGSGSRRPTRPPAGAATARGPSRPAGPRWPHPHGHHRPAGASAGQQLVGVVAEVGEDGLQVGLAERPHRPTRPVIVVEGPRSRAGHRRAPCGGVSRRRARGLAMVLARSRLGGALAGRLGVTGAVGGALLGLDPLDGRAGPLPVGPLA
jgi:hypothetical protein